MPALIHARDTVPWYMSELTSRIVAETGIPSDRYHLGKIILQSLKDEPEFVLQIDAETGKSETSGSVLERSVRCAISLKKMGLKSGDVMAILGPNHLDMAVVWYAGLYLGVIVAPLDMQMSVDKLKEMFQLQQPKLIFCQKECLPNVTEALDQIDFKSNVITFDEGSGLKTLSKLLAESAYEDVYSFKPENIDPENAVSCLSCTSGSTGVPKVVAVTHKNLLVAVPHNWSNTPKFPYPTRSVFLIAPIQWMSATIQYVVSPILRVTRIQTAETMTPDLFINVVNKYRPRNVITTPRFMALMMRPGLKERMDLSCFEYILLGGNAVHLKLIDELKESAPKAKVYQGYGSSETCGLAFDFHNQARGSIGIPFGGYDYRLVDPESLQDIKEPFVNGELWVKGPAVFKGYYKNPELTKEVLLEDGWFRTGDIFYRDDNFMFYFVDRLKMLLKYREHLVSPIEIERVIYAYPGVMDVAVTGIPDPECGELLVACVVPRPGHSLTAQEIKDLVKETLSDPNQLRGGVIFMKNLPVTSVTKIYTTHLKEMVKSMDRE